ncbi:AraC family transcriptional regulator [Acinetobacter venetianus]|uniref:AraC family transcriptional regulator n=1 Tax=Acinetobacter venetianus TaxID=52133 RepID=UPI0007783E0E|nr:helix-turn-helix transcriptional regulator [Acinetobacter venetianus]KXZ68016.1 Helix-turn-helix domain protein [Acinetobacter venetianus]
MKRAETEQFPFFNGIEVHEFLYQKDDVVSPHSSLWGDFNFSLNGTLEFDIEGQYYLSPPSYGLWLPPRTEHQSLPVEHEIHYICIRLHPRYGQALGLSCRCFSIEPFFRSLVLQILEQQKQQAQPEYLEHLLQVLFDQLKQAPAYSHYLPQSTHPILAPILEKLSAPDSFHQSLQQVLQQFSVSERHILRLSQQELQLSLSEWRNRAKIIFAINQIREGMTIKQLAFALGYHHSSSFIEFFKRYTGQTPIQLKNASI